MLNSGTCKQFLNSSVGRGVVSYKRFPDPTSTEATFLLLEIFCYHLKKPLMAIRPILPDFFNTKNSLAAILNK